jgi:transcriptional regulator of acetoin/glycerol metabolism
MIDHGTTPTDAAKIIGIGRATLYSRVAARGDLTLGV